MIVTSNPLRSPSFPPSLQPSSSNPWNRNPSGTPPAPLMGEPSSWPPLPSSSQIRPAVTATAMATAEQTPDEIRSEQITDEIPSTEVIDPPSIPAPEPVSDSSPGPSPESTTEPDPAPALEPTAPSPEFGTRPRPSAPRQRGPNHAGPNHHRGRNHRPQHGRGNRAPFFPNGGNFNPPPAPNWNPGFGFGPMWPPHQPMGISLGVPLSGVPPLNYYDINLPPIHMPLPRYGSSFYPELNMPFYNFPLMSPGPLPLGAVPYGPHAPPSLPPMNLDQEAALSPTPPPLPPMNDDQRLAFPPPPPPPSPPMNEDQNAVLLVELRKQIEYYFCDQNLVRDTYLKRQMDDEGWVDIRTIASFPMVAKKTSDLKVIEEALSSSDSVELQDNKLRKKDGWARYCIPRN